MRVKKEVWSGETNSARRKMERGVCKEREGRSWKTVSASGERELGLSCERVLRGFLRAARWVVVLLQSGYGTKARCMPVKHSTTESEPCLMMHYLGAQNNDL